MPRKVEKRKNQAKILSKAYFDTKHPGSFGGVSKLSRSLKPKIKRDKIQSWLNTTETYALHKPVKRKFRRRKHIVSGLNHTLQVDLTDLPQLSKYNDNHRYILLTIDIFSRKAYARPLKTKTGKEVAKAFEDILDQNNLSLLFVNSDSGSEFKNKYFQKLLSDRHISFYTPFNQEIKCSIVERLQRTLKEKMFRYFTHSNSYRYIDILDDMIESYNNTFHSSIGMPPNKVNFQNQELLWQKQFSEDGSPENITPKFKVGELVRISRYSEVFDKGYIPKWSVEVFTIEKIRKTNPVVYELADEGGEKLDGTFYEDEMQKSVTAETFRIEEILGKRKVNGRIEYLVKWKGYPSKFNSYVKKRDMVAGYKN